MVVGRGNLRLKEKINKGNPSKLAESYQILVISADYGDKMEQRSFCVDECASYICLSVIKETQYINVS